MSSSSANGMYAVSTVLPALSTVVVGLRFYARSVQKANLQFDDWAQIPALLLYISMAVIAIIATAQGALGHPSPITAIPDSAPSVILAEKYWFALQIIQIPTLALIKIAALRFYRRVFCAGTAGYLYIAHWVLIVIILIWTVSFLFFYIFSCGQNVWAAWSGLIDFVQHCKMTEVFEPAYAGSDFVIDTFVILLPLPSIWRLHATLWRKLAISAVFLLASIGYAASIARLAVFVELSASSLASAPPDIQTQDTQATWFSMLEIGFATIALNMPSLWILFRNVSLETIVRSVRGVFSISNNSNQNTTASRTSRATKSSKNSPRLRQSIDEHYPGDVSAAIELEPADAQAGFSSSPTSHPADVKGHEAGQEGDLEQGIQVEQTIDQHENAR